MLDIQLTELIEEHVAGLEVEPFFATDDSNWRKNVGTIGFSVSRDTVGHLSLPGRPEFSAQLIYVATVRYTFSLDNAKAKPEVMRLPPLRIIWSWGPESICGPQYSLLTDRRHQVLYAGTMMYSPDHATRIARVLDGLPTTVTIEQAHPTLTLSLV